MEMEAEVVWTVVAWGWSFKPVKDGFEVGVLSFSQDRAAYLMCLMSQAATSD